MFLSVLALVAVLPLGPAAYEIRGDQLLKNGTPILSEGRDDYFHTGIYLHLGWPEHYEGGEDGGQCWGHYDYPSKGIRVRTGETGIERFEKI